MTKSTTTKRSAPRTARDRARAELVSEIKSVARRHLSEHGSSALSLRAVARDVGMVSSAVYRYFPSRDDLLTALIIDAYVDFGSAVQAAEQSIRRGDLVGRWMAAARAARRWALASPHEFALIFGSPVPGYVAPVDTVDPAAATPLVLLGIVTDAAPAGNTPPTSARSMPRSVRSDLRALAVTQTSPLDEHALARAIMAWTQLIGSISFELFGHLHNVINDLESYFDYQMREIAQDLGFAARSS